MKRLLLNMIVKNETARIERCLRSVLPVVCGGVIADTGSTDDTCDVMQRLFDEARKPLEIVRTEFVDFSQARNFALRAARASKIEYDYVLFADADHELITNGHTLASIDMTAPAYSIVQDNGACRYWNVRALRRDTTCEYEGPTHECIIPPETPTAILGWHYADHEDGSNRVEKYTRDVKLLMEALRKEPENPRYVFYMVQSLFGAGLIERAREFCDLRLKLGGLPEERFWTQYHKAQFGEMLPEPVPLEQTLREYQLAYELRPWRAEPLVEIAARHRKENEPHTGLLYARQAAMLPLPETEVLPVITNVYEWRALDEWLVCAGSAGNYVEARIAAKKLRKRTLPLDEEQRKRIKQNITNVLPMSKQTLRKYCEDDVKAHPPTKGKK